MWLRAVCRLGLLCRGTVYLLVGYLALRLALAAHGRTGAPAMPAENPATPKARLL